ncbi:fatty acid-binding protein 2, liver-like [Clavelina lepadiformis]|uniref:Cytosolic fatty-acid binding proteins domain-containing protein n=1 Tax=Clavelina lepadiformis TaxID=159417 RepID=A0ABP0H607_CLALP
MSFAGTWTLIGQEGYEEFMKLMGVPEQYIAAGKNAPVSLVIQQNGNKFSVETITGPQSWTDKFEIGLPATITGPGRKQMQTVVVMENGSMQGEYDVGGAKIKACRELNGDILYDILSVGDITFKRTFSRK